jgi:hypothetical protein
MDIESSTRSTSAPDRPWQLIASGSWLVLPAPIYPALTRGRLLARALHALADKRNALVLWWFFGAGKLPNAVAAGINSLGWAASPRHITIAVLFSVASIFAAPRRVSRVQFDRIGSDGMRHAWQ